MINGDYFKNFLGFWGLFFNCSSLAIEVSEPHFSFFKKKKTQQKCNPLAGGSYTKLPKQVGNPSKGFINIQIIYDDDNECFNWCLLKVLHPEDHHPARTAKAD